MERRILTVMRTAASLQGCESCCNEKHCGIESVSLWVSGIFVAAPQQGVAGGHHRTTRGALRHNQNDAGIERDTFNLIQNEAVVEATTK